ncbi:MAG: (2Fe-2S)-binding protein [Rhodospirillaceae bacterium]|nr:(2Fe-2S)-binding protein [Rhodospirillaceae bacterium]
MAANFKLNGKIFAIPADLKDVTLVEYLRDHLGQTGTKFGCGIGSCGACTVHIDGQAERSCQTVLADIAGAQITTIEGLSFGGKLHPVQEAWITEQVPQCGYCQPGQIMTAAALQNENPNPNDQDIRDAMNGNLCRCGTYQKIRNAVRLAAGGQIK